MIVHILRLSPHTAVCAPTHSLSPSPLQAHPHLLASPPPFSFHKKHHLHTPPPPRPVLTPRRALNRTLLHPIRHSPPPLHLRVRRHARHVLVECAARVLERREERRARGEGQEDGVLGGVRVAGTREGGTEGGRGVQSSMLQSFICANTAGHTAAWHSL